MNPLLLFAFFVSFDNVPKPIDYNGFTVTVEYDETSSKMDVTRKFYEQIIDTLPRLNYYKTTDISFPEKGLPAVIVRCNNEIVYSSFGRTPPFFVWDKAIDYFVDVLEKKSKECVIQ